jgi:hypothetical protein
MMFYYKKGRVETHTQWNQPSYESLQQYCTDLLNNTDILNQYQTYFTGAILYDIFNTWDVDLHIVGSYSNLEALENDLDTLSKTGFDNGLLIDAKWKELPKKQVTTKQDLYNCDYQESINTIEVGAVLKIVDHKTVLDFKIDATYKDFRQLNENLVSHQRIYNFLFKKYKFVNAVVKHPVRTNLSISEFLKLNREEFYEFSLGESAVSSICQGEES